MIEAIFINPSNLGLEATESARFTNISAHAEHQTKIVGHGALGRRQIPLQSMLLLQEIISTPSSLFNRPTLK